MLKKKEAAIVSSCHLPPGATTWATIEATTWLLALLPINQRALHPCISSQLRRSKMRWNLHKVFCASLCHVSDIGVNVRQMLICWAFPPLLIVTHSKQTGRTHLPPAVREVKTDIYSSCLRCPSWSLQLPITQRFLASMSGCRYTVHTSVWRALCKCAYILCIFGIREYKMEYSALESCL